jgi:hypothetical protein
MVLMEGTFWPLVVVGVLPDYADRRDLMTPLDDEHLTATDSLRLAVVIAGTGQRARQAQDEVLAWLCRRKTVLARHTDRIAWIIEDDAMRTSAEAWQALLSEGWRAQRAGIFRAFGPALRWLLDEPRTTPV